MFDLPIRIDKITDDYMVGEFSEQHDHWKPGTIYVNVGSVTGVFKMLDAEFPHAKRGMESTRASSGFHLTPSWEECMRIFRYAPSEINKFAKIEQKLRMHETPGSDMEWDVSGDILDVGRYLDGEPECFGVMKMGNPLSLFANVYFDFSSTGGTAAATMARRGANMMAYVDFLEANNVRAKVTAYRGNETALILVNVKDYGRMMTVNNLAVTAHPDFLRRIGFRISENSKSWAAGYGSPHLSKSFMDKIKFLEEVRTLNVIINPVFGSDHGIDEQFDKLVAWTKEMVAEGRGGTYRVNFERSNRYY